MLTLGRQFADVTVNLTDQCSKLELELIQSHMAQKPVLRGEVGCACVAREVRCSNIELRGPNPSHAMK